ncbi:GntR family transcriptional regulator [Pseudonocardia pini]|uniref:GntR family transcriptional regulator n=1 Tax=Pseudonocardia pini TaxID=2758030 RepID=UPI0015F0FED4|nr:GntR family transcriptional regulator [Pseudonocardia pini]
MAEDVRPPSGFPQRPRDPEAETNPRRAYEFLRAGIRRGSVDPDRPLYDTFLSTSLRASRNTVRSALRMLAADGLVSRRQRTGTRVVRGITLIDLADDLPLLAPELVDVEQGAHRVVEAPPPVQEVLGHTGTVLRTEQLVRLDGEPILHRVGYLLADPGAGEDLTVRMLDLNVRATVLTDRFRALFGREMGGIASTVEAIACDEASAALLQIPVGAPVLLREIVLRDVDDRPLVLGYQYYRGDRVAMVADLDLDHR